MAKETKIEVTKSEWVDWAEKAELEKKGYIVTEVKVIDGLKKFKLVKGD